MCGYGMRGWGIVATAVTSIVFLAAIVAAVVLLTRYLNRSSPSTHPSSRDSAERLLAERYARGDIDEREYQQRLGVLRGRQQT